MGGAEAGDGLGQSPKWDGPSGSTWKAGGQLESEPTVEEQPSPGPGIAGFRPHPVALLPPAEALDTVLGVKASCLVCMPGNSYLAVFTENFSRSPPFTC